MIYAGDLSVTYLVTNFVSCLFLLIYAWNFNLLPNIIACGMGVINTTIILFYTLGLYEQIKKNPFACLRSRNFQVRHVILRDNNLAIVKNDDADGFDPCAIVEINKENDYFRQNFTTQQQKDEDCAKGILNSENYSVRRR